MYTYVRTYVHNDIRPISMEPFAVAIGDVLVDLPFDITGVKLLWWTWHDTDPNIEERSYSVPLTR